MDNKQLCQWLRDNSSGVYRPAAVAAERIENLERENSKAFETQRDMLHLCEHALGMDNSSPYISNANAVLGNDSSAQLALALAFSR